MLCTDPYVTVDADLLPLEEVLARGRPARSSARRTRQYRDLDTDKPVVDVWNLLGHGQRCV